ncbi:MAG: tetratricopeptide repeat protein [Geobacteraceae bacterium]|nr:tetratricopeptide repeat protein [Geobacteraceae bacterium]
MEQHVEEIFHKGLAALENGHIYLALSCFEQAACLDRTPLHCSYLAFCLAKVRSQYPESISLCKEALRMDPDNSIHYLHLGRIHLMAGQRAKALGVFRRGLQCRDNESILREITLIGERKNPVLSNLPRHHPVNKYLGIVLKKLGMR